VNRDALLDIQGDSSRLPDFIEDCKREFAAHGLKMDLVSRDDQYEYNIVIAQESYATVVK
jgi:hypothetical protein